MTGISEHTVNNSSYLIADGSVILPDDDTSIRIQMIRCLRVIQATK